MPHINPDKVATNWLIESLCLFLFSVIFSVNVFLLVFLFVKIRGPISVAQLIPTKYFYWPIALFVFLTHSYMLTVIMMNLAICGSIITVYLVYVSLFLKKELELGRLKYKSIENLRSVPNVIHVYRSFQVLQMHAMSFMGIFLVMCNAIFMMLALYANVILIRHWYLLQPMTKATFVLGSPTLIGFWALFLDLGRVFSDGSTKVLLSWKTFNWGNAKEAKLMSKFRKSCKPIRVSYGSQFVVGKVSVFKFLRGVVRGTLRALLTTKRHS